MPLSTTPAFPGGLETWQAIDYTVDHIGDNNRELDLYVKKITNTIDRLEAKVGIDNSAVTTSLDFQASSQVDRRIINVQDWGVLPSAAGSVNAFIFNVRSSSIATGDPGVNPTTFLFPPGVYNTTGFQITHTNHGVLGVGGMFGTNINFVGAGTTVPCFAITGSTTGGYDGRLWGVMVERLIFTNGGPQSNQCFLIRHVTDSSFKHLKIQGFRGDGAVDGSNFADSHWFHCDWQFCASIDDSDNPVLKFWYDGNGVWGCDSLTFFRCKLEVNGDRLIEMVGSGGFRINKVSFIATKFESSGTESYKLGGSTGANGAQILVDGCGGINFINCDFTLQDLRAGHAILPCIFRIRGASDVHCSNVIFSFGSGAAAKCFTYFFIVDGGTTVLTLVDTWIVSGNSTAFPTQVIQATNTPYVVYRCCGFDPNQGAGKTAANWITGAVANATGGAGAGVIA